ncbi:hypothetical protein HR12_12820 [Microbacterium sp. SUBG005]|nr:hypothetical protein HR12_12820 [Microbacterium sp. SUBG005]
MLDAQGFTPGDALSFELDGVTLITSPVVGSTEAADANGGYTGDASIPDDAALGVHTVSVTDASGSATATTTITVVPQPTATVSPSSISLSDYLANGVTVTFSGFAPGETVGFGISDTASGIRISPDQTADANGEVTLHWVTRAGGAYAAPGTYEFRAASSDLSTVSQTGGFTVTADVAAVSPTTTSTTQTAPVATAAQAVARAVAFTG